MRSIRRFGIATAGALVALADPLFAQCPAFESGVNGGSIAAPAITEASGLAASRLNPGILWINNDSGNSNDIYALTPQGVLRGTYTLSGTSLTDWEDMAVGPGPTPGTNYIYVGDIGDNANGRSNIKVYRVPEPLIPRDQQRGQFNLPGSEAITLVYPDGPRDAETLMVDVNGDIYIVSKRVTPKARVYRAAFPQSTSGTITLEFIIELPWGSVSGATGATGGCISADGSAILVRRYTFASPQATLWTRSPGMTIADALAQPGCDFTTLIGERQGEAVCFAPTGLSFYTTSEGASQPLYVYQHNVPIPPIFGDLDGDGVVGSGDLAQLLAHWGQCPVQPPECLGDLTFDGAVGPTDLAELLAHWG